MTEETSDAAGGADQQNQAQFALQRIYLKDLSFEAPQGADAFRRQWQPKVNQDLSTRVSQLEDDNYEVVLQLTVTVKDGEDTLYLVEIQQAGIFQIRGVEGQQLTSLLNTQCPQIVFPYARETVDSVVTKGTFPALMLPPINFDAVFQQAIEQARQQQEGQQQQADQSLN